MPKFHPDCLFFSVGVETFYSKITLLTSVTPVWPFDPWRSCDINGRWSLLLCPSLVGIAWSMLKLWLIEVLPERKKKKKKKKICTDPEHSCLQQLCKERRSQQRQYTAACCGCVITDLVKQRWWWSVIGWETKLKNLHLYHRNSLSSTLAVVGDRIMLLA